MFWTIVGALVFVLAGIPLIIWIISHKEFWIFVGCLIIVIILIVIWPENKTSPSNLSVGTNETANQFFGGN